MQIHGNVCMQAVVVTETLDWRLHGFDLLSEHQPPPGTEWPLMSAGWMVRALRLVVFRVSCRVSSLAFEVSVAQNLYA